MRNVALRVVVRVGGLGFVLDELLEAVQAADDTVLTLVSPVALLGDAAAVADARGLFVHCGEWKAEDRNRGRVGGDGGSAGGNDRRVVGLGDGLRGRLAVGLAPISLALEGLILFDERVGPGRAETDGDWANVKRVVSRG